MTQLKRSIPQVAVILWLAAVGAGFLLLIDYGLRAGSRGDPRLRWPTDASLVRSPDHATLLMIAHPRCPCTRASLRELAVIMTRCQGLLTAYLLFIKPPGTSEDWTRTDLWREAGALPGVTSVLDDGSVQAARFGATTSGQVLLYGADGRLMFSGGITPARGDSGDNAGRESIVSLLRSRSNATNESPVYGCPLFDRPRAAGM